MTAVAEIIFAQALVNYPVRLFGQALPDDHAVRSGCPEKQESDLPNL